MYEWAVCIVHKQQAQQHTNKTYIQSYSLLWQEKNTVRCEYNIMSMYLLYACRNRKNSHTTLVVYTFAHSLSLWERAQLEFKYLKQESVVCVKTFNCLNVCSHSDQKIFKQKKRNQHIPNESPTKSKAKRIFVKIHQFLENKTKN